MPAVETPPAGKEAPAAAQDFANLYSIGEPDPVHDSAAASTATATPAATAAATPVASDATHPKWLLKQHADLGLPAGALKLTTDDLGELVAQTAARARQEAQAQGRQSAVQGDAANAASAANPGAASASQPTVTPEPAFDWGEIDDEDDDGRPIKRKVDEKELHPSITRVLKDQAKRIAELEGVIRQGQQAQARAQEQSFEQKLDAAFGRHPGLFGQGSAAAVKDTPAFKRRKAVFMEIRALTPEQRAGMTIEQAVDQFAAELFGAQAPAPQQGQQAQHGQGTQQARGAADEWNAGAVSRPTPRRNNDDAPSRAKAVDAARQYFNEHASDGGAPAASDATLGEFLD